MPANHNVPHSEEAKAKISASHLGKAKPWKRRETRVENGITSYKCARCKEFFPAEGFYKTKRTLLGIKNECRKCHNQISTKSRNTDRARNNNREYMRRARATNAEKFRKRDRARSRPMNEQVIARSILNLAIRRADVKRPNSCSHCGRNDLRIEGHHYDYSEPLAVLWLCSECHGLTHRSAGDIGFKVIEA